MATSLSWPFTSGQADCWLLADYSTAPASLIDSMETPSGASVDRLFGSTGAEPISASVIFTAAEHAQFRGWLRYEVGYSGAPIAGPINKWFTAKTLSSGVLDERELRFVPGSISEQPLGRGYVRVSAQCRTRVGTEMTADEYAEAQAVGGVPEFTHLNNLLDQLVNQSYPAAAQEYS